MSPLTTTEPLPTRAVRPPMARKGSSGTSLQFPLELGSGPTPPSLVSRGLMPPGRGVDAITSTLENYRLTPSPDRRGMAQATRAPSPLPPPLQKPLPSDLEDMSLRLNALVQQSNAYVAGLKNRLDALDEFRSSWARPATRDQLTTFLDEQAEFKSLDVDRLVSFGLPLSLWQRMGEQVLSDHGGKPTGLPSILYWRARAEAEALGFLNSDRRSSAESSAQAQDGDIESRRPSVASVLSVASLYARQSSPESELPPPSRRPSQASSGYMGPRRASTNTDAGVPPIAE